MLWMHPWKWLLGEQLRLLAFATGSMLLNGGAVTRLVTAQGRIFGKDENARKNRQKIILRNFRQSADLRAASPISATRSAHAVR